MVNHTNPIVIEMIMVNYSWLVVWNMTGFFFHSVGNVIVPTDELILFRGVGSTANSNKYYTMG